MPLTDDQLFGLYLAGDSSAFSQLYGRYSKLVWSIAQRTLRDRHAADDVLQETFASIHNLRRCYKLGTSFNGWVRTLIKDQIALFMRRQHRIPITSRYPSILQCDGSPLSTLEMDDEREHVREVVTSMLPAYRRLVEMYYFEDKSYEDIALVLDIPRGTAKSRLHSAVNHFVYCWRELSV